MSSGFISCRGKIKHKTYANACVEKAMAKKNTGFILFVYKCKRCGFYHTGKPSVHKNSFIWNKNMDLIFAKIKGCSSNKGK